MALMGSDNAQGRGFELERVMYELFELFDLDPKASFKNVGEQIDGAFSLEGTEYLFEAKWHKELVNKADLAIFTDKVRTKLENTLGVFLSINGFSPDGVSAHQAVVRQSCSWMVAISWLFLRSALTSQVCCSEKNAMRPKPAIYISITTRWSHLAVASK